MIICQERIVPVKRSSGKDKQNTRLRFVCCNFKSKVFLIVSFLTFQENYWEIDASVMRWERCTQTVLQDHIIIRYAY